MFDAKSRIFGFGHGFQSRSKAIENLGVALVADGMSTNLPAVFQSDSRQFFEHFRIGQLQARILGIVGIWLEEQGTSRAHCAVDKNLDGSQLKTPFGLPLDGRLTGAEGLSNALIEYLAAGLPSVATTVGGNGEVVAHQERGLLVPARSPFALAAAMERLLRRPDLAAQYGKAGRSFVERELTIEQLAQRHDRFYREVLEG